MTLGLPLTPPVNTTRISQDASYALIAGIVPVTTSVAFALVATL